MTSVCTAYMRFCNFTPEFTEEEVIRFLRSRGEVKARTRKTYVSYLRIFFRVNGIERDKLPFEYGKISVPDDEVQLRKTMSFPKVVEFIKQCKRSNSAQAKFFGALVTT